jgi:hypothetical protein
MSIPAQSVPPFRSKVYHLKNGIFSDFYYVKRKKTPDIPAESVPLNF